MSNSKPILNEAEWPPLTYGTLVRADQSVKAKKLEENTEQESKTENWTEKCGVVHPIKSEGITPKFSDSVVSPQERAGEEVRLEGELPTDSAGKNYYLANNNFSKENRAPSTRIETRKSTNLTPGCHFGNN